MSDLIITKRHKILLSNTPELLATIRESILQTSQVVPLVSSQLKETMALVRIWKPDLLILASRNVVEECQILKNSREFRSIPIIAIIPGDQGDWRQKVLEAGCDDWLPTPLVEIDLLNKVQNLVGLLFRKFPRYTYRAPAMVNYRGKEFPSQSIDINRRMIFLESNEGLAPATGRNVHLNFRLSDTEKIRCWGRVERLMARQNPHEKRETIGMLIRFLDLPKSAARRIDVLAWQQGEQKLPKTALVAESSFSWLAQEDYAKIAKALIQEEDSELFNQLAIPKTVFQSYLQGLTPMEKESLQEGSDSLLNETIALRLKLMDELTKWKHEKSFQKGEEALMAVEKMIPQIQKRIEGFIEKDQQEAIIAWAKIQYEIIRTEVEIKFLQGDYASLTKTRSSTPSSDPKIGLDIRWLGLLILLILSMILNIFLLV